jgi:hypothetical protein
MRVVIDTSEANDKDFLRAEKLGSCHNGEGHDNYLKGITVQLDVCAPLYWWKEAQRYHWFDFRFERIDDALPSQVRCGGSMR